MIVKGCFLALGGLLVFACSSPSGGSDAGGDVDVLGDSDVDASVETGADAAPPSLCAVTATDTACPNPMPPAGSTCKQLTLTGCPGIPSETIHATAAILLPMGAVTGTIVHFSGSGGQGWETNGAMQYRGAGFRQVFVGWSSDWEQTVSSGIKTAGSRPASVLQWVFSDPMLHASSRALGFCGQGFSGGSGQLGYALAHYGMADKLDYVNELSGPPFARIDLGCDGNAPATAMVCNASDTMRLPNVLDKWENIPMPYTCGAMNVPQAEIDRWKNDSIAVGGVYAYPKTDVEFYDCTNQATAVTAMAQIYEQLIAQTEGAGGLVGYHCYSQSDGCQGEGLGTGMNDAVTSMLAGCKPRH